VIIAFCNRQIRIHRFWQQYLTVFSFGITIFIGMILLAINSEDIIREIKQEFSAVMQKAKNAMELNNVTNFILSISHT